MFDLGWSEMLLIGIVALIVVGPKELPGLFRSIGVAVGKARGLAREFSRAMEAAADEAGVKEIDRTIRAATKPMQFATDRLREQASPGRKAALPAAGTPLDPGAPLAPSAAAEAASAPVAASPTATERLAERRAEERAGLIQAAGERQAPAVAPAAAPAPAAEAD